MRSHKQKMCEDCEKVQPTFGLPGERRKRWCAGCGRSNGAVSLSLQKVCEECRMVTASFGMPGERMRRWCSSCGKQKGAVRLSRHKMCEGCGELHASFGLPGERTKRWCAVCRKNNGATSVPQQKMCVACGMMTASFTVPGERTSVWCSNCGKDHHSLHAYKLCTDISTMVKLELARFDEPLPMPSFLQPNVVMRSDTSAALETFATDDLGSVCVRRGSLGQALVDRDSMLHHCQPERPLKIQKQVLTVPSGRQLENVSARHHRPW